jgi:hypothetical protein
MPTYRAQKPGQKRSKAEQKRTKAVQIRSKAEQKRTGFALPIFTSRGPDAPGASARADLARRGPQKRAEFVRANPFSGLREVDLQQFRERRRVLSQACLPVESLRV